MFFRGLRDPPRPHDDLAAPALLSTHCTLPNALASILEYTALKGSVPSVLSSRCLTLQQMLLGEMTSKSAPDLTAHQTLKPRTSDAPPNHRNAPQRGKHNPERSTHRNFHRKAVEWTGGDSKIEIRSQKDDILSHSRCGKVNYETSGFKKMA